MLSFYLSTLLAAIICGYTFWKGGVPEKWGAAILALGWGLTPFFNVRHGIPFVIIGIDTACLIGFVSISLVSRKLWSLLAAALQLDDVVAHYSTALMPRLDTYGYVTAVYIFGGYALLAVLLFSLWEKRRDDRYLAPKS